MSERMLPMSFSKSESLVTAPEAYVPSIPHMISDRRWEKGAGRASRCACLRIAQASLVCRYYISTCVAIESMFEECLIYNADLYDVSLFNCHVHLSSRRRALFARCEFTNCVITTNSSAIAEMDIDCVFFNCTLRGNFAHPFIADAQREAEDLAMVQLPPFDVFNNVLVHEIVVERLRKWARQHRLLRALSNGHIKEATVIAKMTRKGKEPFYENELFDTNEQVEMATRRSQKPKEARQRRSVLH